MTELLPIADSELVTNLAKRYGLQGEAFINTMRSVAMPQGHTLSELISCLVVAAEHNLNPITREIYFMKARNGKIQPIVSVDGWIKKLNDHPQMDGMEFETIRNDKGDTIAMKCRIYRKDRSRPIEVEEDLKECAAGGGPVWKTHPHRMLRNRVITQAARVAVGMAGVMEPDEYNQWQIREGGDITPPAALPEPQEPLEPEEVLDPRDGGPLPSGWKGRPSSSAFKEVGGTEQFNELKSTIEQCSSRSGLELLYDNGFHAGLPWGRFPSGWARMLHDDYCAKLEDLPVATDADYQVEDVPTTDDGQVADAILQAQSRPELVMIWQSMSEDDQETYAQAYEARYDELSGTMI